MSDAASPNSATPLNGRYEPTDEDRRQQAMYHALSIHGQCSDPRIVIESARLFAEFVKSGS